MDDDSMLPSEEMEKLRREIELLKRKQGLANSGEDSVMGDSVSTLSRSINSLMRIFKEASEEMKMDTHDAVLVAQKLDRILDRLDKIEAQNEKIAKGIVAIADMIEDLPGSGLQRQSIPFQRIPPPSHPPFMQQQNAEPKPLPTYNLPPDEKKKGFINFKI